MPTIVLTAEGKVTGLWGGAIIKDADGHPHPLKLGDIVRRGDVILTTQDGIVELTSDSSSPPVTATAAVDAVTAIAPRETTASASTPGSEVDQVIENLASNDADAATAAGLAGGDGGEFLPGLRVERISESLSTLGLNNNEGPFQAPAVVFAGDTALVAAAANIAPSALDDSASGPKNTTLPVALRGIDSDGNVVSITVTSVPTGGTLLLADGNTIVVAGQTLTPAQAAGLLFKPALDFAGQAAITFFVTDNQGATSNPATVSLNLVDANPPPVNTPAVIGGTTSGATVEDTTLTTGGTLTVTDPDAGEAAFNPLTNVAGAHGVFSIDSAGVWTYTLDNAAPAVQTLGVGQTLPNETFTVTSIDGTAQLVTVSITGTNDAPVAQNDEGSVPATQTLIVSAAEGVILSTSAPTGRDSDIEGDALTVTKVSAGAVLVPTTVVPSGGVTIAGSYGDLLLRSDGSYNYTASRADAVATGTQVNDVFTYQVSDNHGGFATASLTVRVSGVADTLTAAPPTTTALSATPGLHGEYYGYNDFNPGPTSPNRRHADDGTYGNLDRAADVISIVNGRNAAFGGAAVAGSSTAADPNAADARFLARTVDYGTSTAVTAALGRNPDIAPGGAIAGLDNANSQLYKFLNRVGGSDAGTITVGQGTGDNDRIGGGPTSGLGRTSDAAMRLSGEAYLAAGLYDIRVHADDGFRLRLHDQTVALFDNIQTPTTRVYTGVPVDGGLTPLELLYWEQGGNAVLRVEFKPNGTPDSAYQVLASQNLPLFSDSNAPVLSELQDLVAGPTPGSYLVRTGSLLDGGNGDDTLDGSAARDILIGGQGKDALNGGADDDLIRGGEGNDQLTGGAGRDVFRWSLGDAGTAGTPARDVITDFDNTAHSGDVLDLRDLLVGESHASNTVSLPATIGLNNALTITPHEGNLANYLHFSTSGGNTVVEISSTGGFAGSYAPGAVDQVITLTGLNLVGSFSDDHQVINDLLQRGKLLTD